MPTSQWHKFYTSHVAAPPGVLFGLIADMCVHIHYSFEPENASTRVTRWLVLDISMPAITRPLRRLILSSFDKENLRTMAAVRKYAEDTGDAPATEHGEATTA